MSLTQFFRILWARRMIVLVSTLSTVVAAFIVLQLIPPRYEARSRLMLDIVKPDPVTGQEISSPFARAYSKTQENLLRDARVVGRVVDQLGLARNPEMQERFQDNAGGSDFRTWAANAIIQNTEAKLVEGSNILEITYTGSSPEQARAVADALRTAYVDATSEFRQESARQNAAWYGEQAEKARLQLAQAEAVKTQFERQHGLILQGENDVDSARLQALASQGPSIPGAVPMAGGGSSPMSAQLAQVEAQIAAQSGQLGPNHPEMQDLQRRRAVLAQQVARDRAASNAQASAAARAANAGVGVTERAYASQRARVVAQRDKLDQLRQMQAQVDVRREQYTKTATRAAELRQEAEAPGTGLTMLGAAVAPDSPKFPNKPAMLAAALVLGFIFGVLLALLLELMNRRIRAPEDISGAVQVPLIAIIAAPGDRRHSPPLLGSSGSS